MLSIDKDIALLVDLHRLARQSDDPLDIIGLRIKTIREDDHIEPLWIGKTVGNLVHDQIVAIGQCTLHGRPTDPGSLSDKMYDKEGNEKDGHHIQNHGYNILFGNLIVVFRLPFLFKGLLFFLEKHVFFKGLPQIFVRCIRQLRYRIRFLSLFL